MAASAGWLSTAEQDGSLRLNAGGRWETAALAELDAALRRIAPAPGRAVRIDLGGLTHLDTAGAWVIHRTLRELRAKGIAASLDNAAPAHAALIEAIARNDRPGLPGRKRPNPLVALLDHWGRAFVGGLAEVGGLLSFLGLATITALRALAQPGRIRIVPLFSHIEHTGLTALPIIGLLSFLIGVVLAYQGADQLRRFGAEIFTVNLVGVSMLREMGILLAAIIVAGRSGSAFTAQIGTMQVNEEIDAMRTLGLDPIEVLVLPRVIALVIVLPLLAVYSDLMGLLGGALMSWAVLDISLVQFMERLRGAVPVWSFWVGLIKAPVFGLLIALVGCRQGLEVEGSAESVGRQTTRAVVISIFLVIVTDAVFSIFFSAVGV